MKVEKRKIIDVKFILTEEDNKILRDAFDILGEMDSVITEENLVGDVIRISYGSRICKVGANYISNAVDNLSEII